MPSSLPPAETVRSPCVGICRLDPQRICIGCGRSAREISLWPTLTAAERLQVLQKAAQRRASPEFLHRRQGTD